MPKFEVEIHPEAYKDLEDLDMIHEDTDGTVQFKCAVPKSAMLQDIGQDRFVRLKLTPVSDPIYTPIRSAYRIEWTEYEQGFGQRNDGYSYYLTLEDAERAAQDYRDSLPSAEELGGVPECYVMPGTPKLVEVDENIYQSLINKNGESVSVMEAL